MSVIACHYQRQRERSGDRGGRLPRCKDRPYVVQSPTPIWKEAQVAWDGSGPTESSAHVCVCYQNQPRHHGPRSKKGNRARRRPVAPARSLPRAAALPPTCTRPPPAPLVALQGRIYVGVKPLLWKKISVLVVVLGQVVDRTKLTSPFCDSHTFAGGVMRSCWVAAVLAVLGLAR